MTSQQLRHVAVHTNKTVRTADQDQNVTAIPVVRLALLPRLHKLRAERTVCIPTDHNHSVFCYRAVAKLNKGGLEKYVGSIIRVVNTEVMRPIIYAFNLIVINVY